MSDGARSPSCDTLSQVLQDLRPRGVSYGYCVLSAPWGIEIPAEDAARLHLVMRGSTWLRTPENGWTELREGDVALLPTGPGHAVADAPDRAAKPIEDVRREEVGENTFKLRVEGDGDQTLMSCCSVRFDQPTLHPLLQLMPPLLIVRAATARDTTLGALLTAMADEVLGERVGAATVLARLADVVLVRLIRSWVEAEADAAIGWLAAIQDAKIGRALAAVHAQPGDDWTVARLAGVSGMSRSVFSDRFSELVGIPPARYLLQWRMRLAALWLQKRQVTVAQAASRLGYESESSFSRAFTRTTGVPPSVMRRRCT